jgi:hypothetical protein
MRYKGTIFLEDVSIKRGARRKVQYFVPCEVKYKVRYKGTIFLEDVSIKRGARRKVQYFCTFVLQIIQKKNSKKRVAAGFEPRRLKVSLHVLTTRPQQTTKKVLVIRGNF